MTNPPIVAPEKQTTHRDGVAGSQMQDRLLPMTEVEPENPSRKKWPAVLMKFTTPRCSFAACRNIGVARGPGPPPPIKTPLTTKSYDNIA